MIFSKEEVDAQMTVTGEDVERVCSYKYLGCWLNGAWDCSQEIKSRRDQARGVFVKMKSLRDLTLNLRMRIGWCYVLPVLFYGLEG